MYNFFYDLIYLIEREAKVLHLKPLHLYREHDIESIVFKIQNRS